MMTVLVVAHAAVGFTRTTSSLYHCISRAFNDRCLGEIPKMIVMTAASPDDAATFAALGVEANGT